MKQRSGQTLIEVLLALAIILVGLLSLTSALINAQITAAASVDEAVATQLAREPIEAARFIRDSNWLERENGYGTLFNDRLSNGTDYTAVYGWNPPQSDPTLAVAFNFTPDVSTDPLTKVYTSAGNLFRQTQTSTVPLSWVETIYSRYVTLFPICSSDGGFTETMLTADGNDCGTDTQIGIQVISTVTWSSRGTDRTTVLEERLYDWRYATP